ncbi:hypothetical protein Tco_0737849 [Tanacetum coccineum]
MTTPRLHLFSTTSPAAGSTRSGLFRMITSKDSMETTEYFIPRLLRQSIVPPPINLGHHLHHHTTAANTPPPGVLSHFGMTLEDPACYLAKYAEARLEESHERQTRDGVRTQRTKMIEQDIETLCARAEATEQRAKTLQVSLGAAHVDIRDLIESRRDDKLEMAELRSRAQDIEASFWDLERHLGL